MTVKGAIRVRSAMVRIAGHLAAEKLTGGGSPDRAQGVPKSADHLTKQWLTAVLCKDAPGAAVVDFSLERESAGSTNHRVVVVSYNDIGAKAGLPARLFTKSTPDFHTRLLNGMSGALYCEAAFYQEVRPLVSIETPVGYHMGIDPRSYRSMFLIEDIASTRGARFGDPTTLKLTKAMAQTQLELLASLHAEFWDSPRFDGQLSMLRTTHQWMSDANEFIDFEGRSVGAGFERSLGVLPDELHAQRDQLWPSYMASLKINVAGPRTLQHQDLHLGNWYVTPDDRMGLFDWQCMAIGGWAKDVAYAIAAALTVEDRRAWERDLVAYYVDQVNGHGVTRLSFDQAWLQYRQQTFHALFFWLYTIGRGPLQPHMQPDHICLANVERMSRAVVDLDSFDALDRAQDGYRRV